MTSSDPGSAAADKPSFAQAAPFAKRLKMLAPDVDGSLSLAVREGLDPYDQSYLRLLEFPDPMKAEPKADEVSSRHTAQFATACNTLWTGLNGHAALLAHDCRLTPSFQTKKR
jgi:hypothetical protein